MRFVPAPSENCDFVSENTGGVVMTEITAPTKHDCREFRVNVTHCWNPDVANPKTLPGPSSTRLLSIQAPLRGKLR